MGAIQGKRAKTVSLLEKLKKLRPEIDRTDIVTLFAFDLHHESPDVIVDGMVLADKEYLTVYSDGEEMSKVKLDDISEIKHIAVWARYRLHIS